MRSIAACDRLLQGDVGGGGVAVAAMLGAQEALDEFLARHDHGDEIGAAVAEHHRLADLGLQA